MGSADEYNEGYSGTNASPINMTVLLLTTYTDYDVDGMLRLVTEWILPQIRLIS